MKAHKALELYREENGKDSWKLVKPSAGSYVSRLSTSQEWALMGAHADFSGTDPLDLLIAAEEGTLGWLSGDEEA